MRQKSVTDQDTLETYADEHPNALNKAGQTWEEEIQASIDACPRLNYSDEERELMRPVWERYNLETAAQRGLRVYG